MNKLSSEQASLPMVRATIMGPVVNTLKAEGFDVTSILAEHGLSERMLSDPKAFTHNNTVYQVFEQAAKVSGRDDFCTRVGENIELTNFIPFGSALINSATLGDFITRFTQAVSKDSTSIIQRLLVEDDLAYFSAKRMFQPEIVPAQVDGFMIGIWISFLHRVIDYRWDPAQIIVQMCDPGVLPADFHGVTGIKSGRQGFSIRFPAVWLSYPIIADPLQPGLTPITLDPELFAPSGFVHSVEKALLPHIGDPDLSVVRAAQICGFTKSALSRRLAKHDTTISELISNLKMIYAQRALSVTEDSVSEIASDIGYSDPTAFTRAFRAWFGKSPTDYRSEKAQAG